MASAMAAMQSRRHSRQRQPEAGTFVNIGTPVQITGSESIAGSSLSTRILHFDVLYTGGRLYFLTNVPPSPGLPRPPLGAVFFARLKPRYGNL